PIDGLGDSKSAPGDREGPRYSQRYEKEATWLALRRSQANGGRGNRRLGPLAETLDQTSTGARYCSAKRVEGEVQQQPLALQRVLEACTERTVEVAPSLSQRPPTGSSNAEGWVAS